ncbi:hypothetical protein MMPV_006124 [Pyropia vietnamensis]
MAFVAAAAPLGRPSFRGTSLTTRRPATAAAATTRMATPPLNPDGEKDKATTYTLVSGAKAGLCRCYKSADFPICNGAHAGYNKKTGDRVGPIEVVATPDVPASMGRD